MDEPLYFGYFYSGPYACNYTLAQLANNVAATLQQIRTVFPNVLIGDNMPVGSPGKDKLLAMITELTLQVLPSIS